MMAALTLLIAVLGTLAIFATTRTGREWMKRLGLRDRVPGAAPSADVDYLLRAWAGDRAVAEGLLEAERERYPELTEAEHYRRAIRKVFREHHNDA